MRCLCYILVLLNGIVMLEKWCQSLDRGGFSGALLTDLSKTFECLLHDLLIAKLAAYGLKMSSLKLLFI